MTKGRDIFRARPGAIVTIAVLVCSAFAAPIRAQEVASTQPSASTQSVASAKTPATGERTSSVQVAPSLPVQLPDLLKRENAGSTLQLVVLLTVLSIVPAVLLMVTSFARILIVLTLLRQALGAQQLPPNQIMVGLALFMTVVVMTPTWQRVNSEALQPYLNGQMDQQAAFAKGLGPVRQFMATQIDRAGNDADVDVFTDAAKLPRATSYDQVPTTALIPAFMLSELKVAFAMGFKIFLPFLIIDLVVSTLLVSMGMLMLPPVMVSLPFKLLLFVLADGWRLITAGLIGSFVA